MTIGKNVTNELLAKIRDKKPMTFREQLKLTLLLSVPAVMAQVSSVIMQYIDASMVGHLGANEAASIGLISTSMWLLGGMCTAAATGFSVQVAHCMGANNKDEARSVLRQSIGATMVLCLVLVVVGLVFCHSLPVWLGGSPEIVDNARRYFFIFLLAMPILQISFLSGSMLRCSGNMHVPSALNVMMCVLDVIFNYLLIFPSHSVQIAGIDVPVYGAGLGVTGAALGTLFAELVAGGIMTWYLFAKWPELKYQKGDRGFFPTKSCLKKALQIGTPMGFEHIVMCGAHIITTIIVAPLGAFALAAHSFAITAESLCYMPGYGISDAATTLTGQSVGAGRVDLCRRFAYTTVGTGVLVMTLMGVVMYLCAPLMMSIMTPNLEIQQLGTVALRIESFAEPMFAASIVAYGVFIGAGDTLRPALMNFGSMWCVRLSLAWILSPRYGLNGVWIAMCVELCFRGAIFLVRMIRGKWLKTNLAVKMV